MNETLGGGPHPPEDELLALRDGALPAPRAAELRAHLAACASCRAALDELEALSARTFAALKWADPDPARLPAHPPVRALRPRPHARWVPLARAAAVAAVLLAGAAVLTPLGAVVASWLEARWDALTGAAEPPVARVPPPAPPAPPGPSAEYRITVAGGVLELEYVARPAAGVLALERGAPGPVVVTPAAEAVGDPVVVLPSGVRIGTTTESRGSWRVTVPPGVRRIVVRVAGQTRTIDAAALPMSGTLDVPLAAETEG